MTWSTHCPTAGCRCARRAVGLVWPSAGVVVLGTDRDRVGRGWFVGDIESDVSPTTGAGPQPPWSSQVTSMLPMRCGTRTQRHRPCPGGALGGRYSALVVALRNHVDGQLGRKPGVVRREGGALVRVGAGREPILSRSARVAFGRWDVGGRLDVGGRWEMSGRWDVGGRLDVGGRWEMSGRWDVGGRARCWRARPARRARTVPRWEVT
jgi:hypothetical protein